MKMIWLVLVLLTVNAHAANIEQARQITEQLNTFVVPSQSTTPNKALLYRSNRDNVDDVSVVTNNSITVSSTVVTITRGENLALTRCTADYGLATVSSSTITVNSNRVPLRVLCSTADGAQRAFYVTYQQ